MAPSPSVSLVSFFAVATMLPQLMEAVRALDALRLEVSDIGVRRATLDEVFLRLTGRPADASTDAATAHDVAPDGARGRPRAA